MRKRGKGSFFEYAKTSEILYGFVKQAYIYNQRAVGEESYIVVKYKNEEIKIFESELAPIPFNQGMNALVGTTIPFILTQYTRKNEGIGSNIKAFEEISKPITKKLESGKAIEGIISHILPYGAHIEIQGVHVLLYNNHFSDNGTAVGELYREGQPIAVKFLKLTSRGNILVEAAEKITGDSVIKIRDFERGNVARGTVTGVYPQYVYVNVAPRVDALCDNPLHISIKEGDLVQIKITIVNPEEGKLRGRVSEKLS